MAGRKFHATLIAISKIGFLAASKAFERLPKQFSMGRMMWATFWVCVTAAAFSALRRYDPGELPVVVRLAALIMIFIGPCITVGALYGRALLAAGIGLLTAVVMIGLLSAILLSL
jgi:hypothetical protein